MSARRAAPLALALALLVACAGPGGAPAAFSCGVPHCALTAVPDVRAAETADGRTLVHEPTGARVDVEVLAAGTRDDVDAFLAREGRALALAVTWQQPPGETHGFEVRGLAGQTPPPPGTFFETDPEKRWLATYRNPETGSVLVLRARAPASVWDEAWTVLEPMLTRVVLTDRF